MKRMSLKNNSFYLILILCIIFISKSNAQLILSPNYTGYPEEKNQKNEVINQTRGTMALSLPFFDDFSVSKNKANPTLWLPTGGILINNQFGINPPTHNIATFDGLNSLGKPYNFVNTLLVGATDTLTSQGIDLSSETVASNVYFSFYWQADGLGELPNAEDSLRLQFKNNLNNWVTVWSTRGGTPTAPFAFVILQLNNAGYFHSDFQFRFQSFGRQSGGFDTWHIDYIYMNKNRNANDNFIKDIACAKLPTQFFKRYTAMPLSQFAVNPAGEIATSVETDLNNLNNVFNVISYTCTLEDTISKTSYGNILTGAQLINGAEKQLKLIAPLNAALIPNNPLKKVLKYKFNVLSGDNNTTIPPVDLRLNDTIAGYGVLDNYYAYDDGTAEYGAGINQRLGRVAYRFVLNTQDTLTDVRINFTQLGDNLVGETFVLVVWKRLDNQTSSVLAIKSFPFKYPASRDEFLNFKLDVPVVLNDTFFIGWQQTSDRRITVGYDRNTDANNQIFYSITSDWTPSDATLKGSLLFRPVFGTVTPFTITDLGDDALKEPFMIYPNPNHTGTVCLKNIKSKEVLIYNSTGQMVLNQFTDENEEAPCINIESLPAGLYLLKCIDTDKKIHTQKLIIE